MESADNRHPSGVADDSYRLRRMDKTFALATIWIALGLLATLVATLVALPFVTPRLVGRLGGLSTEVETKWILFVLFGLGALALWAGSEAVLPAYVAGMALAGTLGRNHGYIRRLRTLTFGLLTPFFFLRAGSFVSVPAVLAAPLVLLALFGGKVMTKVIGLFPVIAAFRSERNERWYYTLLMSTGLTFGTISALYGLSHGVVARTQYSLLVAAVVASALVPTMIAGAVFVPRHLLTRREGAHGAGERPPVATAPEPAGRPARGGE